MLLLAVLRQIRSELSGARLLLVGDGLLAQSLHDLAARYGLADRVEWVGKRPYPQMPAFYPQGHLYLQTSRHESQGMAVIEALACGLPALGTPVGVLPQVAAAPPRQSAAALAAQIAALLQPEVYAEQRQWARQQAEDNFSLPHAAARLVQLYEQTLAD